MMGFFGGAFIANLPVVTACFFPLDKLSGVLGFVYGSAAVGTVLGPYIGGVLNQSTGNGTEFNYTACADLASATLLTSALILFFVKKDKS
jgi:MFS family permease